MMIGIDLGGTNTKIGLVRPGGEVASKANCATPLVGGAEAVIEVIARTVEELLLGMDGSRRAVVGAGIGAPGPLSLDKGIIHQAVNLPGWTNVAIRDLLSDRLGVPVLLENDGNAAAYGEFWAGAGKDGKDMVMLTLGTGVGAGVIINGQLLHGHFENAAEVGHMIVERDGLPCPCGQRGCLERYVGAAAVARRVEQAIRDGALSVLEERLHDGYRIDGKAVVEAAKQGDQLCLDVWREACEYLAIACVNLQHLFNPARIVLGGGLAQAGSFLIDPVIEATRRRGWSPCMSGSGFDDAPEIQQAQLGYQAGMIGAAGCAWARFGERHA